MNNHENSITLQDWNPMEDDYLSKRNIYKIDDEDCGLALEGYSTSYYTVLTTLLQLCCFA